MITSLLYIFLDAMNISNKIEQLSVIECVILLFSPVILILFMLKLGQIRAKWVTLPQYALEEGTPSEKG